MKRYISVLSAAILAASNPAFASDNEGGVFLSLTRKPEQVKMLPVNIASISREQMERTRSADIADLLSNQAGINISPIGTAGSETSVMIRGASSAQLLVLIDGRRANNPASGQAAFSLIPLNEVERVEIIRGGASAIYGTGASGGVINIITRKPSKDSPVIELGLRAGSFAEFGYDVSLRSGAGPLSVFCSAGKDSADGYRQNSEYSTNNFFGNFGYDAGAAGKFELTASFVNKIVGLPGPGALLEQYDGKVERLATTPDARQTDSSANWRVDHSKSLDGSLLKTSIYADNKTNTFRDISSIFPTDQENKTLVYGTEIQLSGAQGTTIGAEWWEELYKQNDLLAVITTIDKNRATAALYVQQELKTGKFNFIPSLRYDQNSVYGGVSSPHLSVVYTANDSLKLSVNSGKVWRAPTFDDLYYPASAGMAGNPDLKPEDGTASDAGAEFKICDSTIKFDLFTIQTQNLISWQPVPGSYIWAPANLGNSVQSGAELEFGQKLASGLYHKVSYTYLWAEDTDKNTPLIYRPRNTANYDINYVSLWNVSFGLQAQYVSERLTGQTVPGALPEYTIYNFLISRKVKDFDIFAKINNLTDKMYQTRAGSDINNNYAPAGYPLPGITYSAGVRVRFWD